MSRYDQLIGRIIDGRYRVDALLGIGGMSVVLLGYDLRDKRKIAIKMLREELANDEQSVNRFVTESKAASMMDHPRLVKVYDVVIANDEKYMVMQYIEGETLRSYIDRMGVVPPDRAIAITKQILEALVSVHEKGVVHRDVKPQNILILKNGDVVLTDFGIAKLPQVEEEKDDKTVGTIYYVSPEQAENENVDARSDIYSLGITVFEMMTGTLPFNGESTLEIAKMHIEKEPPSIRDILPTVPKGMEQLVMYAIAKDPADRFQTAEQMLQYLMTLEADPFAVFAITPREQYRIFLEEEKKKKEQQSKAEEKENEEEEETEIVRYVKGDSWSPIPVLSGICVALLIVLLVSGYYALVNIFWDSDLNVFKDRSGEDVIIENYVGEAFTEADRTHLLDDIGYYKVTIVEEYSEIHPKGVVFAQEPKEGEVRKLKTVELTVYVSLGSNVVESTFPDYSMQDYRTVRQSLADSGFNVVLEEVISSAVDSCLIIETIPPAGTKITEGMTVTIRYSAGPDASLATYQFPDFKGKTEKEVSDLIKENGLNLVSVEYSYSNTVEEGRVISCSVSAGPKPRLTPISLVISLGVDPSTILPPTQEPPVTPTTDPTLEPISE